MVSSLKRRASFGLVRRKKGEVGEEFGREGVSIVDLFVLQWEL